MEVEPIFGLSGAIGILFLFLLIEFLKGKFKKRSHLILLLNEYYGIWFSVVFLSTI
jgi:hypothetical protein